MTTPSSVPSSALSLDPAKETERIVASIQKAIGQSLRRKGAVVGVSGGIDSSVVAFLCGRAVGADRLSLILMPEKDSSPDSLRLGHLVADALNVRPIVEDISPILTSARCYERRDDAIRLAIPEYGSGL